MKSEEAKIIKIIKKLGKKLPKFQDGRVNYKTSKTAPVINVFVKYKDRILLLKRSNKVGNYKGLWNSVGGYLDEPKPIRYKVLEELREELRITEQKISKIRIGKVYRLADRAAKTWIITPVLVELNKMPKIKLDFEHTAYKWIKMKELKKFRRVPKIEKTLEAFGYKP